MAAKQYVYISGKLYWVKAKTPESFGDERFWSVTIYPDAEGKKEIAKLKEHPPILNKIKEDDDGEYIKFKRATQRQIRRTGQWQVFNPPQVLDKEGRPIDVMVGNGSDGIVKLDVYSWTKPVPGRAARWESLRVDNLVPYEPRRDNDGFAQVEQLIEKPALPRF